MWVDKVLVDPTLHSIQQRMEGYPLGNSLPGKVRWCHSVEVVPSESEGLACSRTTYILYLNNFIIALQ